MSGEALTFIELDILYCSLEYGVLPCQASLVSSPPTGTDKCCNTLATCQDRANIDLETITLRFAKPTTYLPRDIDIVASSVVGVEFSPAIVSLGENLGQRASLRVTFKDHPHSDTGQGFDKYYDERSYNPYTQGTMWGKFRKRQPFIVGQSLRWITGFVGQSLSEMETRHFFVESFDGPTSDGKYTITAKDVLKFLDGDRAQAPPVSNGFLVADIAAGDTSATLSPVGIGNAEYPSLFFANIGGNEVVTATRSGDNLTISRGIFGTTAAAHSAQDRVQVCLRFDGIDPALIIENLIDDYTDVPDSYLDGARWLIETSTNLNRLYTATITEPTSLVKLLSEIIEQAGLAFWDDNINRVLRLQVLRGISTDADRFSESEVMKPAPLAVTDQPDKRVSQVWVYYGQIDPTKRVDDPDNYRSTAVTIDDEAEEDYGAPAIKKVFARWIPALGRSTAERLGQILLSRYRNPPRKFSFDVMRRNVVVPELGGGYRLSWFNLQDELGAREDVPIQITRLLPGPAAIKVDAEEMLFTADDVDLSNRLILVDFNVNNLNWKTVHDSLYPPIEAGQSCTMTIAAGVIIGSTNNSVPSIDVGTWPAGVTLNLNVIGRVEGKGGIGGNGANFGGNNGGNGDPGGTALFTRESINLDDSLGEIWGGGGGGGGDGGGSSPGDGGGGGAGQLPGVGGSPGGGGPGALPGSSGTTEGGGAGGAGSPGGPRSGGDPGVDGVAGTSFGPFLGGGGGAAGSSIDGISFVTTVGSPGDRRGSEIN